MTMKKSELRTIIKEELKKITKTNANDLKPQKGDPVHVNDPDSDFHGKAGVILTVRKNSLIVKLANGKKLTLGYDKVKNLRALEESILMENVAKTILQQLGGRRFIVMTGAKNMTDHGKALSFRIPKGKGGINYVKITLTGRDDYDMEFGRIHALKYTVKKTLSGVYFDQLQPIFTEYTGLYTSL